MKKFKPAVLLTLVFAAGMAVGVVSTRVVIRNMVATAIQRPETVELAVERRLTRRLDLDGEQRAQLHKILVETQGQIRELRQEVRPRVVLALARANRDIAAILTPEQRVRFEKWKKENALFQREARREAPGGGGKPE